MSDEDILERGGTEEDIAMYAHDVGNACMYPDYPCEICEERERLKKKSLLPKNLKEVINEQNVFGGKCYSYEPTKDQDAVEYLKSENAYLRGIIKAYERFLKSKGYMNND